MITICQVVREALSNSFLSVAAEEQLRECLRSQQYTLDDLRAFWTLQSVVMSGRVKQESRLVATRS
ncbi:MAG: hypothetical protein SW833_04075 [Cyanobacteriota bacterium]|nr:hypothetical protein [Cyanobacteriota bacterium]